MSSFPRNRKQSCKCTIALLCSISRPRPAVIASLSKVPTSEISPSSCITSRVRCQVHSPEARKRRGSNSQLGIRSNWRALTGLLVEIKAPSLATRAQMLTIMPLPWSQAPLIRERIETFTPQLAITILAQPNSSRMLLTPGLSMLPLMPRHSTRAWSPSTSSLVSTIRTNRWTSIIRRWPSEAPSPRVEPGSNPASTTTLWSSRMHRSSSITSDLIEWMQQPLIRHRHIARVALHPKSSRRRDASLSPSELRRKVTCKAQIMAALCTAWSKMSPF